MDFLFKGYWLFLLLVLTLNNSYAQESSNKGWFTANYVRGCTGVEVTIRHTGVNSSTLFYNFQGDINDPTGGSFAGTFTSGESKFFEYVNPGVFYVIVVDQGGGPTDEDRIDFLEITVLEPVTPKASIQTCSGNQVIINFDFTDDPFDRFNIDFGDGTTQQVDKSSNQVIHSYANSNTYNISIEGVFDNGDASNCGQTTLEVTPIETLSQPRINLLEAIDETSFRLVYPMLDPALAYELEIDRGSGFETFLTIDPNLNSDTLEFTDANFDNFTEFYTFRLKVRDACGALESFSEPVHSIAFNVSLTEVNTSFLTELAWNTSAANFASADLYFDQALVQTFSANNSTSPRSFASCLEFVPTFFENIQNGVISRSITIIPFETQVLDLPAQEAPVVKLDGSSVVVSIPNPNFAASEFRIFRKDLNGNFNEVGALMDNNSPYIDSGLPSQLTEACYAVVYLDQCGNISGISGESCVVSQSDLRLPNAFSPNSSNATNRTFGPLQGIFNSYLIYIYNRWGSLVYQSNQPQPGWDGTIDGNLAPSGTYFYKVSYENADNLSIVKTGTFVLIR